MCVPSPEPTRELPLALEAPRVDAMLEMVRVRRIEEMVSRLAGPARGCSNRLHTGRPVSSDNWPFL